jgi:hypothetical protein
MRTKAARWLFAAVLTAVVFVVTHSVWAFCAPSARSIFPASGIVGTTVGATVSGTGLTGATVIVFGEPGVTAAVQTTSDTSVSLNLTIDPAAALGERILSLSTSEGTVSVNFTVNPAGGPIVTGIAPVAVATQGFPINFALTGQNLTGISATNVTVSGLGVTVDTATPTGGGNGLDVALTVAADADVGTHALVITTPLGGAVLSLYVQRPAPVVTTVSPGAGEIGTAVPLTITGSHLTGAALVITEGASGAGGIAISDIATPDDSTLTATLTIGNIGAEPEPRLLIVTTESGQVTAEFFVVAADVPSITSIRPAAGSPGETVNVTLRGLNLTGATLSTPVDANFSLANPVIVDDETATVDVAIGAGAGTNTNHTITATVGANAANATFRVIVTGAPFFSAIRPPFADRGATVAIVVDGVNLLNTTGFTLAPTSGITVSNVQGVDAFTARAILSLTPTASIGQRDVTVTTTTGAFKVDQAFRVNNPGQSPTITAISPDSIDPGTTTVITVTGTGFEGAGVTVGGAGATVSNIQVDPSFASLTFSLTLAPGAAAENRPLILVTPIGSASCGLLSTAELVLRSPPFERTGSVFEVTTPGFRFFVFEFSLNERFDDGPRTYLVSSLSPLLTLSRLDDLNIRRATRDLPFGYVRVQGISVTNQIGRSETFRFRR